MLFTMFGSWFFYSWNAVCHVMSNIILVCKNNKIDCFDMFLRSSEMKCIGILNVYHFYLQTISAILASQKLIDVS